MKKFSPNWKTARKKIMLLVTVALLVLSISATMVSSNLFEISKNIDIFTSIYRELNTYYVDDIDPNKVMREGIDAMLKGLDPYTNYISEAEMENHRFQMTGKYGGIGAIIRKVDDYVVIIEPYEDFAAFNAGLKAGDILLEVDGKSVKGKSSAEISDILRGSPGTDVELLIERPFHADPMDVKLTRQEIKIDNVPYYGLIDDDIGYIKLTQFTDKSGQNVEKALRELQKDQDLSGLILDLRGNPGGLLREAVNVCNVFIPKGEEVVSTRGKVKDWDKTFRSLNGSVDEETPLVVLTNRGSASASEIVSGVVQDLDRAVVVGQRTFGKGLVQSTRDISYKTKLKITTAKYYIPSGRCIQAIDYSHRNDDGSVGNMPDSLKTAFTTKNGRVVYDGGGIYPDVDVEVDPYAQVTVSLLSNNHIFNYATKFAHENPEISDAKTFELSQADFQDFTDYLSDKEYDYTTESEDLLEELEESSKNEKYHDAIVDNLSELKKRINIDKENDLQKFKDEIIYELEREIVTRYYYQTGTIEASFDKDPDIQEAFSLLRDSAAYGALLATP